MKILILGATGFIGSAVALKLARIGHMVTGFGRNLAFARRRYPDIIWHEGDLRDFITPQRWLALIENIDAVVNCAGALQDTPRDDVTAVQNLAMGALYEAAKSKSGFRIIQISAAKSLADSNTVFMNTKLKADAALAKSGVEHVILRPALVLGRNANGGSALLRAMAAMPFAVPLAFPQSIVETVSLDRVTEAVAHALDGTIPSGTDIDLIDVRSTLADLVAAHRQWLGLPRVSLMRVPGPAATALSRLADLAGKLGWRSPLRSTAMIIAKAGITAGQAANSAFHLLPPDMRLHPAAVQDLWFARLYALKPLIILALSLFWLMSGFVPLLDAPSAAARFGDAFTPAVAMAITLFTCLADICLGFAILIRRQARLAMFGMLVLSLAYLFGASLLEPALWIDPLGPLVKVLPSLVLTVIGLAILDER
ncbi:MAG: SDR family oxidoreductase [Rhizobiaceae bacterium]